MSKYSLTRQILAAALATAAMSGAQAAAVTCGDLLLGTRTVTVTDAKVGGLCYGGLSNLGDGALETLVNTLTGATDADIIDRDNENNNGGTLSITGQGGTAGGWSFSSTAWDDNDRLFLYFHFGDQDGDPLSDPDIFIIELNPSDSSGSWSFNDNQGLSNIALIGTGGGGGGGDDDDNPAPEPGSLALVGLGLAAAGVARRRQRTA